MMNDSAVIPHERMLELIGLANSGDEAAFETIVSGNVALVKSIVKKYIGRGVEYDDLFQLGCMGLIKAVRNFDTSYDVRFSTYAVPMIAGEIKRFMRDDGMIKVTRSQKELGIKAISLRDSLSKSMGHEVGIEELAKELCAEAGDVAAALEAMRPHVSIYEPIHDGDDGALLMDRIAAEDTCEDEIIDRIYLKELLGTLNARDRQVIMLRYFKHKTQSEVAKTIGVSQVQVSRIESRVLMTLRNSQKSLFC